MELTRDERRAMSVRQTEIEQEMDKLKHEGVAESDPRMRGLWAKWESLEFASQA